MFLPIANREIRSASQRPATFQIRAFAPLILLTCSFNQLLLIPLIGVAPATGPQLFANLAWIAFAFCLFAGIISTINSIIEEKENGTLGLLLLTPLRGFDIILGKLSSSASISVSMLLASLPIFAMPILLGGVTIGDLARIALALIATLFCALSVGLFFSTICKTQGAAATLILLAFCAAIAAGQSSIPALNLVSPGHLLDSALHPTARWAHFQDSLLCITALSFSLLLAASWLLPRVWRDKPHAEHRVRLRAWTQAISGPASFRAAFRQKALSKNPILWVSGRSAITTLRFALILITLTTLAGLAIQFDWGLPMNPIVKPVLPYLMTGVLWFAVTAILHLYLLLLLTFHSSRWIVESRRAGALELIATSPLRIRQIIRGHWQNLFRRATPPFMALLLSTTFALIWFCDVRQLESGQPFHLTAYLAESFSALIHGFDDRQDTNGIYFLMACLLLPTTWITLGWLGPYLALRLPKPNQTPLLTLLLITAPPWIIFSPIKGLLDYLASCHHILIHRGYEPALWTTITLLYQITLILITRHHLRTNFLKLAVPDPLRAQTQNPNSNQNQITSSFRPVNASEVPGF